LVSYKNRLISGVLFSLDQLINLDNIKGGRITKKITGNMILLSSDNRQSTDEFFFEAVYTINNNSVVKSSFNQEYEENIVIEEWENELGLGAFADWEKYMDSVSFIEESEEIVIKDLQATLQGLDVVTTKLKEDLVSTIPRAEILNTNVDANTVFDAYFSKNFGDEYKILFKAKNPIKYTFTINFQDNGMAQVELVYDNLEIEYHLTELETKYPLMSNNHLLRYLFLKLA
jgi:hypothetical protein